MALALTLLVGAGLLLRSFARLQGVEPRVRSIAPGHDERVAAGCEVQGQAGQDCLLQAAQQRIAALPGVVSVGATTNIPFGANWWHGQLHR